MRRNKADGVIDHVSSRGVRAFRRGAHLRALSFAIALSALWAEPLAAQVAPPLLDQPQAPPLLGQGRTGLLSASPNTAPNTALNTAPNVSSNVLPDLAVPTQDDPSSVINVPVLQVDRPDGLSAIPLDLIGTFKTLDKVTARTGIIRLPINEPIKLGRLTLTMRSCKTAPPEAPPETSAFLEIDEERDGVSRRLFTGWMFASSPGMHALEHPIHDVWPIICRTSSGDIYSGSE